MRRALTILAALIFIPLGCAAWLAATPGAQSSPAVSTAPKYQPPQVVATASAAYPINSVAFGTVVLEVHLDAAGAIQNVSVSRDIPSLTKQALLAIQKWRFTPAMLDGKPVKSIVPVAFIFVRPDLYPRYGGNRSGR